MYVNAAYLNNDRSDLVDETRQLLVSSCGTYRLESRPVMETCRPHGRRDYQLLYVAAGKTHFLIDGQEQPVAAGNMVLFRPGEPQIYTYYGQEQPEVFWVHFTGSSVEDVLRSHCLLEKKVFQTGVMPEYSQIFRQMIREMQLCRPMHQELVACELVGLFLLLHRHFVQDMAGIVVRAEIAQSVHYFHENYSRSIVIEEYAQSLHMSVSWFIRGFREYTGLTPTQYILQLRMANARSLLEERGYNVSEVAAIVGYDNALYFSRLFKRQYGHPPSFYKKQAIRQYHSMSEKDRFDMG